MKINMGLSKDLGSYKTKFKDTELSSVGCICLSSAGLKSCLYRLAALSVERSDLFASSYIQGVSRLGDITAAGDFLGLCDHKSSYKHVPDFGRLRSYDRLKLRGEGNDY